MFSEEEEVSFLTESVQLFCIVYGLAITSSHPHVSEIILDLVDVMSGRKIRLFSGIKCEWINEAKSSTKPLKQSYYLTRLFPLQEHKRVNLRIIL